MPRDRHRQPSDPSPLDQILEENAQNPPTEATSNSNQEAEPIYRLDTSQLSAAGSAQWRMNPATAIGSSGDSPTPRILSIEEIGQMRNAMDLRIGSEPSRPKTKDDPDYDADYHILTGFLRAQRKSKTEWHMIHHGEPKTVTDALKLKTLVEVRSDGVPKFRENQVAAHALIQYVRDRGNDVVVTFLGRQHAPHDIAVEIYYNRGHSWGVAGSAQGSEFSRAVVDAIIDKLQHRG